MATYYVPCIWSFIGSYAIEAKSQEDAIDKAYDADLPENGEYLADSFEVLIDEVHSE